ncbi:MAG: hypothetical protein LUE16_10565 [Lachnospiraceae bacterium]|nr:hypothetical protein [Lachnospiraceae bacterium]
MDGDRNSVTAEKKMDGVREFRVDRELMDERLTARILVLPGGVEAHIYGGCLPHIGAVSIVDPDGCLTTTQFPGHKDGVVSDKWAKAIAGAGRLLVTVAAGIHYDNLTKEGIGAVVEATDEMLEEALKEMRDAVESC